MFCFRIILQIISEMSTNQFRKKGLFPTQWFYAEMDTKNGWRARWKMRLLEGGMYTEIKKYWTQEEKHIG